MLIAVFMEITLIAMSAVVMMKVFVEITLIAMSAVVRMKDYAATTLIAMSVNHRPVTSRAFVVMTRITATSAAGKKIAIRTHITGGTRMKGYAITARRNGRTLVIHPLTNAPVTKGVSFAMMKENNDKRNSNTKNGRALKPSHFL